MPEDLQIDEPTDLEIIDPDEEQPEPQKKEDEPVEDEDDFPFGF